MQTFVQPPNKGEIKTWMAFNLGVEKIEADLRTKPVHNHWFVPGITDRILLTEAEMYDKIELVVCLFFHLDHETFISQINNRLRELVVARHVIFHFVRQKTWMPSGQIGTRYHKDHSTVLHSCKQVAKWLEVDKFFRADVHKISDVLSKYRINELQVK